MTLTTVSLYFRGRGARQWTVTMDSGSGSGFAMIMIVIARRMCRRTLVPLNPPGLGYTDTDTGKCKGCDYI